MSSSAEAPVAIKFDHVTKTYKLYENDRQRFFSIFSSRDKRKLITKVNASNDLSFEIKKGEAVAFLGHNGAGKSTALKMITGVTFPTKGEVIVNGTVSALLELTAGFDMALTGREHIHLRGHAMGLDADEIAALEPKVVEFADLGVYIDQPVRTYSSGMKSRLGFAFAVSSDPEILVVDEALSVGDKQFQQKCFARVREIMEDEDVTVLFVTHSSSAAQEFCTRGIVLDKGKVVFDGIIAMARENLANGIPVGLGTDTGCPYITHYDMWRELCYFVKYCGVTPAFALHTATLLNARLAGIDGETGSIEAGKAADLIVCAKDPLADLSALRTLSMVIKDGYRVEHPAPKKLPEVERELDKFL